MQEIWGAERQDSRGLPALVNGASMEPVSDQKTIATTDGGWIWANICCVGFSSGYTNTAPQRVHNLFITESCLTLKGRASGLVQVPSVVRSVSIHLPIGTAQLILHQSRWNVVSCVVSWQDRVSRWSIHENLDSVMLAGVVKSR
jgi:hypothetical protein